LGGRNDQCDGLADRFSRRVPVHPLRTRIPADNCPVERLADDGIVGRFDNRAQKAAGFVVRRN
jgi:hypothetical protein